MGIPSQAHVKKQALYFGCFDSGHYLHSGQGRRTIDGKRDIPGFPWSMGDLDTGLLKNGKRLDIYDGRVFWTCGGSGDFWYAFFWWDRSGDARGNSCSGFYVRGFDWPMIQQAFDFACVEWPTVIGRQKRTLVLQSPFPPKREKAS